MNAKPPTKGERYWQYLKTIGIGIISLPIALIISTVLVIVAVLLLPLMWAAITLVWVNTMRNKLTYMD